MRRKIKRKSKGDIKKYRNKKGRWTNKGNGDGKEWKKERQMKKIK